MSDGFSIVGEMDISLFSGWNLISLCQQPSDSAIESVLSIIAGKYLSVWSYENGSWKLYDPANLGFSDLLTMDAGSGYWINMNEIATLSVTGSTPSSSVELVSDWNLAGYNSCTAMAVGDAMASIGGKYESVWAYLDGVWILYDPANLGFSDLLQLEPGLGYWIKTTETCTWTLP